MVSNDVLQGLTWDQAAGALDYKGIRYMLVRPETVVVFQKAVEERLGREAGAMMFAGGKAGGGASAQKLHQSFGLPAHEVAAAMCRMGTQLGWGSFRVVTLDQAAGVMEIEVDNSAYAWAYGPSAEPACHFIEGVFAGVAEIALGRPARSKQTKCAACGDKVCRFLYNI